MGVAFALKARSQLAKGATVTLHHFAYRHRNYPVIETTTCASIA